jgi:hypothetical protein
MVFEFQKRSQEAIVAKILANKQFPNHLFAAHSHDISGPEAWLFVIKLVDIILKSQIRSAKAVAIKILVDQLFSRQV